MPTEAGSGIGRQRVVIGHHPQKPAAVLAGVVASDNCLQKPVANLGGAVPPCASSTSCLCPGRWAGNNVVFSHYTTVLYNNVGSKDR